jgi:hypothetical protein
MILDAVFSITGLLLGIAGPLALAHYGRSPERRLDRPQVAVAAAVPVVVSAAVDREFVVEGASHGPIELLADFGVPVAYGLLVGLFGLAAYGVIDRLLLARIRGTNRPAESR